MKKLLAIVLLSIAGGALGQSGNFPALVGQRGTTLPTNCTIGQLFFDTDATAGGNIYGCTAANTWTQMEGGSAITGCTYAANVLTCPTITATTKFLTATGNAAAPSYSFSTDSTTGIWYNGGLLSFTVSGINRAVMGTGAFQLINGYNLGWADTAISRYDAKQLRISGDGTGATTNAGWIVGYLGVSGYGALWNSGVTPSTTNYALTSSAAGNTYINGTAADAVGILASGVEKAVFYSTSGRGMSLTAGSAITAVSPLSITQTWNAGGVTFPGMTLTVTNTASATGSKLFNFLEGTTSRLSLDITGYLEGTEQTAPAAPAANGYRLYAQDNGGGKTQLCALFNSGVAQCFATEP